MDEMVAKAFERMMGFAVKKGCVCTPERLHAWLPHTAVQSRLELVLEHQGGCTCPVEWWTSTDYVWPPRG